MAKFEFLIHPCEELRVSEDFLLFYVLQGTSDFTIENQKYRMNTNDFLMVNVDERYSFSAKGNFLAAGFYMPYSELSSMLKKNMIYFQCNTVVEDNEICNELRGLVKQAVMANSEPVINEVRLNSIYYTMMNIVTETFMTVVETDSDSNKVHKFDDRKRAITEYIRSNYNKEVSLNELASKLYLSNAYLSKYIKRQFGMSFLEYVNSVRLNFAISQLLHSDKPVVHIAMDTGFASSAALNKAFRDKYGMTPTAYRNLWREQREKNYHTLDDEKIIRERVGRMRLQNETELKGKERRYDRQVVLNHKSLAPLPDSWNQMINIGSASDLLMADMQKQVLFLKQHLNFKYVRFWDIYSPEMMLDRHSGEQKYNFNKLDAILDFLVNNGMKPYIELRSKPKKLVMNTQETVLYRQNDDILENPEATENFISSLIIHLMNRFSTAEVESWYFEFWKTEMEEYLNTTAIDDISDSITQYLEKFDVIASAMRKFLPNIRIGGGGFSLRYGENSIRENLVRWSDYQQLPNFISIYCYPYTMDSIDLNRTQSMNQDYLKDTILAVRRIMEETEFPVRTLHVSEWNFSVSNRNILNDHCMKGAYILKNLCDSMQYADLIGYWVGSDLFSEYYDSYKVLNGGGGLISKFGIPKPAYFSYQFMNLLGRYLQKQGENYIITSNGNDNYRIACHNLKRLGYQYGNMLENEINMEQLEGLFEDLKTLRLNFELPVKAGGNYKLQIQRVNAKHGSLQDEWIRMDAPERLSFTDVEYLERVTIPQMRIREVDAHGGKLKFEVELEPNEIMYIHATYVYR